MFSCHSLTWHASSLRTSNRKSRLANISLVHAKRGQADSTAALAELVGRDAANSAGGAPALDLRDDASMTPLLLAVAAGRVRHAPPCVAASGGGLWAVMSFSMVSVFLVALLVAFTRLCVMFVLREALKM